MIYCKDDDWIHWIRSARENPQPVDSTPSALPNVPRCLTGLFRSCKPILNRVKCFTHDQRSVVHVLLKLHCYYDTMSFRSILKFILKIFTASLLQCLCCVHAQKICWTTNNTWIWQTSDSRPIIQTILKPTQTILYPVKSTIKIVLNTATFLRARLNWHHHFLVLLECFILTHRSWFVWLKRAYYCYQPLYNMCNVFVSDALFYCAFVLWQLS